MLPGIRLAAVLLVSLAAAVRAPAQAPKITMGPAAHISASHPNEVYAESFLAINPRDQRNLIATAIVSGRDGATGQWSDVFATFDGGRTWVQGSAPPGDTVALKGGDPVVFFDTSGTAYFARLGGGGFILSRSTDGGRTWKVLSTVSPRGFDREYLVIDNTGGKFNGRMYAIGNGSGVPQRGLDGTPLAATARAIALTTSTDSGRTFALSTMVSSGAGDEQSHTPSELFVMTDGTIVAPFVNYSVRKDGQRGGGDGRVGVAISRDGGRTFDAVRLGPIRHWSPGLQGQVLQSSPLRAALDQTSGQYKGRIYLTFNDWDEARKQYVIKLVSSSDTGKTWTQPVIVDDDTTKATMAVPAVAVNKDGVVGVVWHDRRDDPTDLCYRLYFAASTDGGATFLPNVVGSDRPACAATAANQMAASTRNATLDRSTLRPRRTLRLNGPVGFQMIGGHTIGIATDAAGVFYAAWTNAMTGVSQLWLQRFTITPAPSPVAIEDIARADVTDQVDLTMSAPTIDSVGKTLSITVRLKNTSKKPLSGPFTLVLDDAQSAMFRDLKAVRADNKATGRGATWNIADVRLDTAKVSEPRVLSWSYSGMLDSPAARGRRDWATASTIPEPFRVSFIVLGGKK